MIDKMVQVHPTHWRTYEQQDSPLVAYDISTTPIADTASADIYNHFRLELRVGIGFKSQPRNHAEAKRRAIELAKMHLYGELVAKLATVANEAPHLISTQLYDIISEIKEAVRD